MVVHRGTHGTCYELARQILEQGFRPSQQGRVGGGVYFWAYEADPQMARALAIGWVREANRKKVYAPIIPQACGVIYAEFAAPVSECLDCSTVWFEETLNGMLGAMEAIGDDDLATAYQTVISMLEAKLQVRYRIVQARVSPPQKMPFKQHKFVGNPTIHLVRSGWEEIKVNELEQVPLAA